MSLTSPNIVKPKPKAVSTFVLFTLPQDSVAQLVFAALELLELGCTIDCSPVTVVNLSPMEEEDFQICFAFASSFSLGSFILLPQVHCTS